MHFLLQIVIFCRNAGGRRYLPIELKNFAKAVISCMRKFLSLLEHGIIKKCKIDPT